MDRAQEPATATTCVVFGGSSGIGEAVATRLASARHRVVIAGRDGAKLRAASTRIADASGSSSVATAAVDATDRAAVDGFFRSLGPFEHLVLSITGGKGGGPFLQLDLDDLRGGLAAKLLAQLSVVQAAHGTLRAGGSITLVSAISARAVMPGIVGLGAINAALESTVPKLALELAPTRVNAVAPGIIDTPWWSNVPEERRKAVFEQTARTLPVGRIGAADDVARVVEMIIGNGFLTGVVIDVDGGGRFAR